MTDFYVPREIVQVNAAECKGCGKVLRSYYGHDFRTHHCEVYEGRFLRREYGFMVDGGLNYIRRGWDHGQPGDHYIERSVVLDPKIYANLPGPRFT